MTTEMVNKIAFSVCITVAFTGSYPVQAKIIFCGFIGIRRRAFCFSAYDGVFSGQATIKDHFSEPQRHGIIGEESIGCP
jgi:hypothetical protein